MLCWLYKNWNEKEVSSFITLEKHPSLPSSLGIVSSTFWLPWETLQLSSTDPWAFLYRNMQDSAVSNRLNFWGDLLVLLHSSTLCSAGGHCKHNLTYTYASQIWHILYTANIPNWYTWKYESKSNGLSFFEGDSNGESS